MCQSKAAGGKRCFAHHPGTKASISYVHAKTGIDKEQIYAIMKELRKEGKSLEAPTPEELDKFFQKEEFMTRWDNTLSEKEKVAILRQILAARLEADQNGVQGGVFHSWKNALKRTVDKFKRPFIATAVAGSLLFTAACSAGNGTPSPGPDETSTPVATECVINNTEDLGVAAPGEIRTDKYGSYCTVVLGKGYEAGFKTIDWANDAENIKAAGFTAEDVTKLQDVSYHLVVAQTLDSTRLDNYSQPMSEWFNENKDIVNPDGQKFYNDLLQSTPNSNLGLIITDQFTAPLPRDNAPRVSNVVISTYGLQNVKDGNKDYLNVGVEFSANYKTSDENVIALIQKYNPSKTVDQIKAENPTLSDSDPNSIIHVVARQNFAYEKNDVGKVTVQTPTISGSSIQYSLFSDSGAIATNNWGQ